jgi:hypothetical protein
MSMSYRIIATNPDNEEQDFTGYGPTVDDAVRNAFDGFVEHYGYRPEILRIAIEVMR